VTASAGFVDLADVVPDGAGGAYFLWTDARTPANGIDVYA
jgi:hypothetical protein